MTMSTVDYTIERAADGAAEEAVRPVELEALRP